MTKFTFKRTCNDGFPGVEFDFDEYRGTGFSAVSDLVSVAHSGGERPSAQVQISRVSVQMPVGDDDLELAIREAKAAAREIASAVAELDRDEQAQQNLASLSLVRCHGPLVLRAAPCSTSHLFPKRDHAAVVSYRSGLYQICLSFGTDGRDMEYLDARKIIESRWPGEPVCGYADHAMATLGGVATLGDAELLFKHMIGLYRSLGLCD